MTTKITLPVEIDVNGSQSAEVSLRAPSMRELVAAGDILIPTVESEMAECKLHNNRTVSALIPICLKVEGQNISSITLDNLPISVGLVLRDAVENIVGKELRVANEHTTKVLEAEEAKSASAS